MVSYRAWIDETGADDSVDTWLDYLLSVIPSYRLCGMTLMRIHAEVTYPYRWR